MDSYRFISTGVNVREDTNAGRSTVEAAMDLSAHDLSEQDLPQPEQLSTEDSLEPGQGEPELSKSDLAKSEPDEKPRIMSMASGRIPPALGSSSSDIDEKESRRQALVRRAAEEAEVKAAEAAEKSRRETGAPIERDAPDTIFDYYKPKVLDPVYVGGYWKRANPWDKGRNDN